MEFPQVLLCWAVLCWGACGAEYLTAHAEQERDAWDAGVSAVRDLPWTPAVGALASGPTECKRSANGDGYGCDSVAVLFNGFSDVPADDVGIQITNVHARFEWNYSAGAAFNANCVELRLWQGSISDGVASGIAISDDRSAGGAVEQAILPKSLAFTDVVGYSEGVGSSLAAWNANLLASQVRSSNFGMQVALDHEHTPSQKKAVQWAAVKMKVAWARVVRISQVTVISDAQPHIELSGTNFDVGASSGAERCRLDGSVLVVPQFVSAGTVECQPPTWLATGSHSVEYSHDGATFTSNGFQFVWPYAPAPTAAPTPGTAAPTPATASPTPATASPTAATASPTLATASPTSMTPTPLPTSTSSLTSAMPPVGGLKMTTGVGGGVGGTGNGGSNNGGNGGGNGGGNDGSKGGDKGGPMQKTNSAPQPAGGLPFTDANGEFVRGDGEGNGGGTGDASGNAGDNPWWPAVLAVAGSLSLILCAAALLCTAMRWSRARHQQENSHAEAEMALKSPRSRHASHAYAGSVAGTAYASVNDVVAPPGASAPGYGKLTGPLASPRGGSKAYTDMLLTGPVDGSALNINPPYQVLQLTSGSAVNPPYALANQSGTLVNPPYAMSPGTAGYGVIPDGGGDQTMTLDYTGGVAPPYDHVPNNVHYGSMPTSAGGARSGGHRLVPQYGAIIRRKSSTDLLNDAVVRRQSSSDLLRVKSRGGDAGRRGGERTVGGESMLSPRRTRKSSKEGRKNRSKEGRKSRRSGRSKNVSLRSPRGERGGDIASPVTSPRRHRHADRDDTAPELSRGRPGRSSPSPSRYTLLRTRSADLFRRTSSPDLLLGLEAFDPKPVIVLTACYRCGDLLTMGEAAAATTTRAVRSGSPSSSHHSSLRASRARARSRSAAASSSSGRSSKGGSLGRPSKNGSLRNQSHGSGGGGSPSGTRRGGRAVQLPPLPLNGSAISKSRAVPADPGESVTRSARIVGGPPQLAPAPDQFASAQDRDARRRMESGLSGDAHHAPANLAHALLVPGPPRPYPAEERDMANWSQILEVEHAGATLCSCCPTCAAILVARTKKSASERAGKTLASLVKTTQRAAAQSAERHNEPDVAAAQYQLPQAPRRAALCECVRGSSARQAEYLASSMDVKYLRVMLLPGVAADNAAVFVGVPTGGLKSSVDGEALESLVSHFETALRGVANGQR